VDEPYLDSKTTGRTSPVNLLLSFLSDLIMSSSSVLGIRSADKLITALAIDQLAAANRTTLNVTTKYMELTFENSAIMARLPVCSPILGLLAIPDALMRDAAD
jgi:hypothetical protein